MVVHVETPILKVFASAGRDVDCHREMEFKVIRIVSHWKSLVLSLEQKVTLEKSVQNL